MKTPSETLATLRQPLGALALLVGLGAFLAALGALLLPALPKSSQERATMALAYVPGLYSSLEISAEHPQGSGVLRLEAGERVAARYPATEEAWSGGEFELEGFALPALLALWGALAGLVLHLLWFVTPSRRVLGLALLLGVASGLVVAHTVPMAPRYWASFWLRGAGGLPGLNESVGSPVGIENLPSSASLASTGGRVAEYPPGLPPWDSESRVEIEGRGRAWFAAYGVASWLAVLLVAAAVRAKRWRIRVPLAALGLGGLCWLTLPFLPRPVGEGLMDLLSGGAQATGVEITPALRLMEATRLGHDVGFGLLVLLVSAWFLVLVPMGLAGGALAMWSRRSATKQAGEREAEAQAPPESIAVTDRDEPDWMSDYEQRRDSAAETVEPHPAPADDGD